MNVFVLAILDGINVVITTFLLFNLLLYRKKYRGIVAYSLIFLVGIGVAYLSLRNNWPPVFKTVIILGGLLTFFNGTVPKKIMAVVFQMQLGMLLDFFHGIWLSVASPDMDATIIEILTLTILGTLNFIRRDKAPLIEYFDKKYILVWILFTLNFLLCGSVVTSLQFSIHMKILITVILILTSGINIYFCYYLEKTRKIFEENLIISKQVEFQENKLEQNKAYLEKNNRLMHDIKRHYLEIEHALSENQMDYVKEYMKGVYQQYFKNVAAGFTGNQIVDSMLFSLKDQCEKEGIDLEYEITIDKKITLHEQDLAVLLGSLFDRAMKTVNHQGKIMVLVKTEAQHLLIKVDYSGEPLSQNVGLTKKMVDQWEETQSIYRIVEKYHGMYETKEEQAENGVKVILPLR